MKIHFVFDHPVYCDRGVNGIVVGRCEEGVKADLNDGSFESFDYLRKERIFHVGNDQAKSIATASG